jgi:hypothetical protein
MDRLPCRTKQYDECADENRLTYFPGFQKATFLNRDLPVLPAAHLLKADYRHHSSNLPACIHDERADGVITCPGFQQIFTYFFEGTGGLYT